MPKPWLFALLVAAGCGEDFTPTLANPWAPGDPGDTDCSESCEDIADVGGAHLGQLVLYHDPTATDGVAQFEQCARSVLACWTGDADLSACVAASACPEPCRTEYARIVGAATDLDTKVDAVEAVFLADDAPCRQPAAGVSP